MALGQPLQVGSWHGVPGPIIFHDLGTSLYTPKGAYWPKLVTHRLSPYHLVHMSRGVVSFV